MKFILVHVKNLYLSNLFIQVDLFLVDLDAFLVPYHFFI